MRNLISLLLLMLFDLKTLKTQFMKHDILKQVELDMDIEQFILQTMKMEFFWFSIKDGNFMQIDQLRIMATYAEEI